MSSRWWSGIAAGFFALIVAGANLVRAPVWLRTSSYGAVRWVAEAHAAWQTRQWPEIESPHFRLRYREQDATVAPIVLAAAEEAYAPVEEMLGNAPRRQTLIILYPDRRSLALQFGWPASESAMGVYWGGVIRVLSPLIGFRQRICKILPEFSPLRVPWPMNWPISWLMKGRGEIIPAG